MSRPSTYEDLPAYARQGSTVVSVELSELPPQGSTLRALGALLDSLVDNRFELTNEHNTIKVSKVRTTEELDEHLAAAQREWDRQDTAYAEAQANPGLLLEKKAYTVQALLYWAKTEGYETSLLSSALQEVRIREANAEAAAAAF